MELKWRPGLLFLLIGFILAVVDVVYIATGDTTHKWLLGAALASFILSFIVP
jgi:hypothetical protein